MILNFDIYGTSCHIKIDLEQVCLTEGKKVEVENSRGQWVKVIDYPAARRRKLFKLIIENNYEEILDDVEQYLTDNSKTFGQEFAQLRGCRR